MPFSCCIIDIHNSITDLVSCGNPGAPLNGFKIGNKYRVGDKVFFGCNSGFNPWGSQVSVCLSSGVWSPGKPPNCFYDKVRLAGGSNRYQGHNEVLHNGEWGTVCADGWDLNNAKVVCRQLGFRGARAALGRARFGRGSGKIWIDNAICKGKETHLGSCGHNGWGVENCSHSEDAGVICIR